MAAPTFTSRINLMVDPDGESTIDSQGTNWGKVDAAAGETTVVSGANSPVQYNGAPVAEWDTGICYTLMDNGAGGFNKRYTTYPYNYGAYSGPTSAGTAAGYINWGWTSLAPEHCINTKAADQEVGGGAGWFAPIKGKYEFSAIYKWIETSTDILRGAIFSINNVEQYQTEKRRASVGGPFVSMQIKMIANLNAGDAVRGRMFNTGAAASLYTSFFASLVRPLI
jgi:hypothetical protein